MAAIFPIDTEFGVQWPTKLKRISKDNEIVYRSDLDLSSPDLTKPVLATGLGPKYRWQFTPTLMLLLERLISQKEMQPWNHLPHKKRGCIKSGNFNRREPLRETAENR